MKKLTLFLTTLIVILFVSCDKNENDNYGLVNEKFGVRKDTVPSIAYTNEAVYANYTINLGQLQ